MRNTAADGLSCWVVWSAGAAQAQAAQVGSHYSDTLSSIMWTLLAVTVVLATATLSLRMLRGGWTRHGSMTVVERLPLDGKSSLCVVRIRERDRTGADGSHTRWLLVGLGDSGPRLITELNGAPSKPAVEHAAPPSAPFRDLLSRLRGAARKNEHDNEVA